MASGAAECRTWLSHTHLAGGPITLRYQSEPPGGSRGEAAQLLLSAPRNLAHAVCRVYARERR
jgi:hypothetical protein